MATTNTKTNSTKTSNKPAPAVAAPAAPAPAVTAPAAPAPAVFTGAQGAAQPRTYGQLAAWLQQAAQGNLQNVYVHALPNCQLGTMAPVPFGYGGRPGGVRATIQNWLVGAVPLPPVNGQTPPSTLYNVLNAAAALGHSRKRPNCLLALLNGGYSPSSYTWGTAYVKLVVGQPPAHFKGGVPVPTGVHANA